MCRSGTKLPNVPMVDVLFSLVFASKVQLVSKGTGTDNRVFTKLICDNSETILDLSHVITYRDITKAQEIRNSLNRTFCTQDLSTGIMEGVDKGNIDEKFQSLLNAPRLRVEFYEKLLSLRDEDPPKDVDKDNFFL